MSEYITTEGAEELRRQNELFHDAIFSTANLLAIKEGRVAIDEVHIKKASKRVSVVQSSRIKWVLAMSMLLLVGLAIFQMSLIPAISQLDRPTPIDPLHLWILPIFSIAWVAIVTYVLRDFL